jgi:alpha-beta hydrolase superfamily lysophospholipase
MLAVLLAVALTAAAAPAPAPAAAPHASGLPGDAVELHAVDGWTLHAVWLKAKEGKKTVVLLHGTGQRKEDWRAFARALAKDGEGYMAVDLRGHGESRVSPSGETITHKKLRAQNAMKGGANDYEDMVRDAEAAVGFMAGAGTAEESIGFAGAEVGGSVAVKYAAVHPKVPFVIVLSPGLAWQEIPLVNAVRHFKGRAMPILMVHSDADKRSSKETPLLFAFAKNAVGEANATLLVVPDERGTRMFLKNKDLSARVLSWIADPHALQVPAVSTDTAAGASTTTAVMPADGTATPDAEDMPDTEPAPADGTVQ